MTRQVLIERLELPGGLEPLGDVILDVGQGAEELSLAGVPGTGPAPGSASARSARA